MVRIVVTLVTGNTSWWKQRKYRRETARRLRRLRGDGWRLVGFERMPASGVDTRRHTAYHLQRHEPPAGPGPAEPQWRIRFTAAAAGNPVR
ncbi:MAG: hypothetical protein ACXW25_05595 [Rhodospirillales bacterium]